jgi:flagellar hook assembly protein FlgD
MIARFTQSTIGVGDELPTATLLYAPVPNPVRNLHMALRFDLAQAGRATIELYDVRGRRVVVLADGERPAGRHTAVWDGRDSQRRPVANGVYFARLVTAQGAQSKRFLVLQP